MNVDASQIRKRDENGELRHAGFKWIQPIARRETFIWGVVVVGQILFWPTFPIFLFWDSHGYPPLKKTADLIWASIFFLSVAMMVLPLVFHWVLSHWSTQDGAVAFGSDGGIWVSAPKRFFQRRGRYDWFCLHRRVSDISSIGRVTCTNRGGGPFRYGGEDGYFAHDVVIQFTSGERQWVAENLDDNDSRIVVAQLNIARREISAAAALAA